MVAAAALTDLRVPPSHRLEALHRDREGQHSIRINDQWRVCFIWTSRGAMEISPTTTKEETMTTPEAIHPGEHLAEIMNELGITQYRLAKTIGVPPIRIHDIVHCRRSITADTALRIGHALGMTPDFWLNLQRMYDLDVARAKTDVSAIEPLVEVSA